MPEFEVLETAEDVAESAAAEIAAALSEGARTLVLTGGTTPKRCYELLTQADITWGRVTVLFGDERCVPPDHSESNYRMASEALLSKVGIPSERVYRMRGEADDPEEAASEYARTLATVFQTKRGGLPRFDLVLLGLGLDGHAASLFPGSPASKEIFRTVVAVHAAAARIPQRLTLTIPTLNAAARVIFLISGAEKAKVVKATLTDGAILPGSMIRPTDGALTWIVDRAAASLLSPDRAGQARR